MDAETREFYAACETLVKYITSQVKAKEVTEDDAEEYTAALRTYFGARTASKSCGAPYYCKENIRATIQGYLDAHSDELNASGSLLSRCLSEDEVQEEEDQAVLEAENLEILLSPDDSIIARYALPWDATSGSAQSVEVEPDFVQSDNVEPPTTRHRGFDGLPALTIPGQKTLSPPLGSYFSPVTPNSSSRKSRMSELPITLTAFSETPQSLYIPDRWVIDVAPEE